VLTVKAAKLATSVWDGAAAASPVTHAKKQPNAKKIGFIFVFPHEMGLVRTEM
jgi:hypothetical protein